MKPIKFRLRIKSKIVGYENWYGGKEITLEDMTSAQATWLYSKNGKFYNPEYIYHTEKDSFTGLLDKNGKEIFEGDIVQAEDGAWEVQIRDLEDGVVLNNDFREETSVRFVDDDYSLRETVIIGNIYENPELLKP